MADFTIHTYTQLLNALMEQGFQFQTFKEYLTQAAPRSIVLRHDVDKRPGNSLVLAKIEKEIGLKGTYYFRARSCSWDEEIIKEIASIGHEIGYHYEDLSTCKGNFKKAIETFEENLDELRKLIPVKTICMHGSPRSRHDSRDLWRTYKYTDLNIIGEPYFDVDFSNVLYLTDTGRRWDGDKVSIRDRVNPEQKILLNQKGYNFHSTRDIIRAAREKVLPDQIMFTIHPQRWHTKPFPWTREYISQNTKNILKWGLRKLNP